MEMFALIKDNNGIRIVKSRDVEEKANLFAKKSLNDFFDDIIEKNGEDYKITTLDADRFESYGFPFGEYIAEKILRSNIIKRKRFEIKKILRNTFSDFNIDDKLITYINNNYGLFSSFYSDKNGKLCVDLNYVKDVFDKVFGELIGHQLIMELEKQLSTYDYSLEYSALEFKSFVLSDDNVINVNRKNFESLLFELGEITDPRISASIRHRCYSCEKLSPLLCKKAEYIKKRIDNYSFINYGYQIFMTTNYRDLMMTSFIVEGCEDYKKSNNNSMDEDEYSYVKRLRK